VFKGIITFFTGVFTGDWKKAWEGLSGIVGGIFQTIGSVIATPINVAIGAINGVIDSINKVQLKIPNWVPIIGGNTYSVNIKKLPFLAQGGVVDKPTTALIGENGAEAVVPLERNTEWINNLANKINDRADNTDTTAVLNNIYQYLQTMNLQPRVTVDDVGRANEKYLDRKLRIQGV
jgi:phage-related protein